MDNMELLKMAVAIGIVLVASTIYELCLFRFYKQKDNKFVSEIRKCSESGDLKKIFLIDFCFCFVLFAIIGIVWDIVYKDFSQILVELLINIVLSLGFAGLRILYELSKQTQYSKNKHNDQEKH